MKDCNEKPKNTALKNSRLQVPAQLQLHSFDSAS